MASDEKVRFTTQERLLRDDAVIVGSQGEIAKVIAHTKSVKGVRAVTSCLK
jgi:hypothetical protein